MTLVDRVAFDAGQAHEWLQLLHGTSPGRVYVGATSDWNGCTFDGEQLDAAVRYAAQLDRDSPRGIYVRTTSLNSRPEKGRGTEQDSRAIPGFWADLDVASPAHKTDKPLPPDESAVRKLIDESGLPDATVWQHSGHGYYAWWLLDRPHIIDGDLDDIKALSQGWQDILGATAERLGWHYGTGVGDLARVLRLPGTVNRKIDGDYRLCRTIENTGRRYSLENLRGAFVDALTALPPPPSPPAPRKVPPQRVDSDVRPGDDYEQQVDWFDILTPHGWTLSHQSGQVRYWVRPGKTKREGHGATTGRDPARDRLYAFTDGSAFPQNEPVTKFEAYAILEHGGDRKAAARALGRQGYGSPLPERPAESARVRERAAPPPGANEPAVRIARTAENAGVVNDAQLTGDDCPRLPADFWTSRPVLAHIRQAALSQGCSGDVALFCVMARIASLVSHELRWDAGLGEGSLNLYAAIIGQSGAGKSTGVDVASQLIPIPRALQHRGRGPEPYLASSLGTGEGLVEAYYGIVTEPTGEVDSRGRAKTERVRKQVRHNVHMYVDEGAQLAKLMERSASTIGSALRSMWGGEAIGQQNAEADRTRHLDRRDYALGMIIGFQQATALPFLSGGEANMGTPQRFLWSTVYDPDSPDADDLPDYPGPLMVDLETGPSGFVVADTVGRLRTGTITFDNKIRHEVRSARVARLRGLDRDADPLDAHEPQMLCKVSSILAILEKRFHVNLEDWQLARVVWDTSRAIRDGLVQYGRAQVAAENEARTAAHASRQVRAHQAVRDADSENLMRIARLIARYTRAEPGTKGSIRRQLAGRDKPFFDQALPYAVDMSWVEVDGDQLRAGPSVPA